MVMLIRIYRRQEFIKKYTACPKSAVVTFFDKFIVDGCCYENMTVQFEANTYRAQFSEITSLT